jgi:hypothetical protein
MRSLKVSTLVLFFIAFIFEASASPSLVGRAKAKPSGGCSQTNINFFNKTVKHKEYFCQWWLSA